MNSNNPTRLRLQKKLQQRQQRGTELSLIIDEAMKLYGNALPLSNAGKYAEALTIFRAAITKLQTATPKQLAVNSDPDVEVYKTNYSAILCLMAECHEKLGNEIEAEQLLKQAHSQGYTPAKGGLINFYGRRTRMHDIYQLLKECDRDYLLNICGSTLLHDIAAYLFNKGGTPEEQRHTVYYGELAVEASKMVDEKVTPDLVLLFKRSLARFYFRQGNVQACYDTFRDITTMSHEFYETLARLVDEHGDTITRPATETEFYWQKLSYMHNNDGGAFDYAHMLYEGGKDFERNYAEAVEIFERLAAEGHPKALHQLGLIYQMGGYGVEQNKDLAIQYYRRSIAEFDNVISKQNLGILLYKLGQFDEAFELLQDPADQGLTDAQICLGIAYEGGFGVEKNVEVALIWHVRALTNGNSAAAHNLVILLFKIILLVDEEKLAQVEPLRSQTEAALARAIAAGNDSLKEYLVYVKSLVKLKDARTKIFSNSQFMNPSEVDHQVQSVRHDLSLAAESQVKMICNTLMVSRVKLVSLSNALLHIGQILSQCRQLAVYKNVEEDIMGVLALLYRSLSSANLFDSEINLGWLAPALTGLGLLPWRPLQVESLQNKLASAITKNIDSIKAVTAAMLFHAFSRLTLTYNDTSVCIGVLAEKIKSSISQLEQRQLGNVLFACAVMNANGKTLDLIGLVLQEVTRRLRTRNVAYLDPILVHQVFLAAQYFSQHSSQQYAKNAAATVSVLLTVVEKNMQDEAKRSIANMSNFQKKYTKFLRAYYPTLRVEQLINGLLVDIVLPTGVIVQIDGPKHFLHAPDAQPIPMPTENFHNAILGNQTVVHVPYFEADQLREPKEIHAYLNSKLPADKKLPEFDPRKHPITQTSFGLSSTSQAASSTDDDDEGWAPRLDSI